MRRSLGLPAAACVLVVVLSSSWALAGARSEAMDAAVDFVMKKFGKEVTEEFGKDGAELLARKMEAMASRWGEQEVVSAVQKVGPRALRIAEEAGDEAAPKALQLMARRGEEALWVVAQKGRLELFVKYGDEAAEAMIKHKGIAEGLIEQFGPPASRALNALDGQGARQLAMINDEGLLTKVPRSAALLDTVAHRGSKAMDWIWRNKGALLTTAVVAAFVENPQPFIDGTVKVVESGGKYVVEPAVSGIFRGANWTMIVGAFMILSGLWLAVRRLRGKSRGGCCCGSRDNSQ